MSREGYKMTELGEIPEEWEVVKLGEIGRAIIGLTYSPTNVVKEGGTLVLRSSNIRGNQLDYNDKVLVNKSIPDHLKTKVGDILICARNGSKSLIGKCAIIDNRSKGHTFGAFMSVYRTEFYKYVFHLFQTDWYRNQIDSNLGSTINQITTGNLAQFKFPLPPHSEQQKIATILNTVDEKIENIDAQIRQTKELKKGLMQQLLTKGFGHTKFKSSELGDIPESWEVVKLKSIGSLTGGYAFKSTKFKSDGVGFQVIRMSNIQPYGLELRKSPVFISGLSKAEERFLLKEGDLIITLTGTDNKTDYGNVAYISESNTMVLNQRVGRFEYVSTVDGKFLFFVFNSASFNKQFFEAGSGGTGNQANVGKDGFESIKIILPPLPEQQKIAAILSTVDEKITSLQTKKQTYQQLKEGLMQQLLTGKIRVQTSQTEPSLA